MEDQQKKAILMQICNLINNSSKSARRIMQNRPISSLKIIARNAKNTKDPNPLQTTLSSMSTRYPISLNKKSCEEYQIPPDLINQKLADTHQSGRILAKIDVLDWWITNSPVPPPETLEIINILRQQPREEVKFWESINWGKTWVRYGQVSLERRLIRQKLTAMNLPKDLRDQAFLQVLAPAYVTPHHHISEATIEQLQQLARTSLPQKSMFATQIRILSSQLNPKVRFAPSVPQSQEITGPIRHAICQGRWSLMGVSIEEDKRSSETQAILLNYSKVVVKVLAKDSRIWPKVIEQVQFSKINGKMMTEILSSEGGKPAVSIMVLRIMCGMKTSMEHIFLDATLSPAPAKINQDMSQNKAGVKYTIYHGIEKVSFKMGSMRGQFKHDSDSIFGIVTNFTTKKMLTEVLAMIATYCRVGFGESYSPTKKDMFEEMYIKHRNSTWSIVCLERSEYVKISDNDSRGSQILTISEASEYQPSLTTSIILTPKMTLKNVATGQEISIYVNQETREIPQSVTLPPGPLDDYLDARRRVERKFMFYMENSKEMISKIKSEDWFWENSCIAELNSTPRAQRVSSMAREHCNILINSQQSVENLNLPFVVFLYIFSGIPGVSGRSLDFEGDYEVVPGITCDLKLKQGIMILIEETGELRLFGGKVRGSMFKEGSETVYSGLLPKYELRYWRGEVLPVVSLRDIVKDPDMYPEGKKLKVFIANNPMIAVKNSRIRVQTIGTITRQVNKRIHSNISRIEAGRSNKRVLEVESASVGSSHHSKRIRSNDSSSDSS